MTNDKGKLMEEFFKDAPKITLSENEQAYYAERLMTARGEDEVKEIMDEVRMKMPGFREELNKYARMFEKKHKLDEKNKGTNTGRV